jgi:WD40 repeat protein
VSTDGSGNSSHLGDRIIIGNPHLALEGAHHRIVDLADIVGGGNGFGTGTRGHGIHPGTGIETIDFNGRIETTLVGDGHYHDVALPFVDGVFVPHGRTQLTHNPAHEYDFDTDNRSFDAIEDGPNGVGWNSMGFTHIEGINYSTIEFLPGKVLCVAFCPDGTTAICGHENGLVSIVDCRQGNVEWWGSGHRLDIRGLDVDPQGRFFVTGAHDSLVKVWDLGTRKVLRVLQGHTGAVLDVAYAPDGTYIASGSQDSTIRLWNAATGELNRVLRGHHGDVKDIAYSPDGRALASASFDGSVGLWHLGGTSAVETLLQRESWMYAVAFSPDGSRLAAGGMDGIVYLLDPTARREVAHLFGHEGRIFHLEFSRVDEALVSTSLDGTIRVWDSSSAESRTAARRSEEPQLRK